MRCSLLFTKFVIPPLPVHEQYRKIGDVEIRDGSFETGWERPRERHEEVTTMKEKCGLGTIIAKKEDSQHTSN